MNSCGTGLVMGAEENSARALLLFLNCWITTPKIIKETTIPTRVPTMEGVLLEPPFGPDEVEVGAEPG